MSKKKESQKKKPDFLYMDLDPDKSFLEQFEDAVMNAPSQEEFEQGLEWLDKNVYQNQKTFSVLHQNRKIPGK